jgi:hypothetical protein
MSQTENITDLTPEQISRFPEFIGKWTQIGLCTYPANRKEAEGGINLAYKLAGLKSPKIVWCSSPLSQGLTRAIVKGTDKKIRASVGDSVRNSVWDSVGNSVRNSVRDSVRNSVWDSVGNSVRASIRDSVGDSVRNSVGDSVRNSVWDSVGNSVRDSVWDSVRNSVWDSVRNSIGASIRDSVWDSGFGQHDADWLGFYDFFKTVCSLNRETVKLCGLWQIAKNAGWYLPHEKLCWVSERHNVLKRDERGRLHSKNSIALAYPDGWGIYAFHGVRVPEYVIMQPEKITADDVLQERNTEVARVKLEQLTLPNFINQTKAVVQDHDIDRQGHPRNLLSIDIPRDPDRVIKIVQVICPSTEREYMLRVPTHIVTCAEAVAWTFGLSPEEYAPMIEV